MIMIMPHPIDNLFTPHRQARHSPWDEANGICYKIVLHASITLFQFFTVIKKLKNYFFKLIWSELNPPALLSRHKKYHPDRMRTGCRTVTQRSNLGSALQRWPIELSASRWRHINHLKISYKIDHIPVFYTQASCLQEKSLNFSVIIFFQNFFFSSNQVNFVST